MKTEKIKTLDAEKYIGTDTKIAIAEVVQGQYGLMLQVTSEVIPFQEGDSLPDNKELKASRIVGFKQNEAKEWVLPQDSDGQKWLIIQGADMEELTPKVGEFLKSIIGNECKVQTNKKGFLELV